ncbi:MAG: hypothetical protein Tsb0014_09860 [Pleurocapsa sp.]
MGKFKQLHQMGVPGVRQPSFSEGLARVIDITNNLGDSYTYFTDESNTCVVTFCLDYDLIESSKKALIDDYDRVGADFRNAKAKIERKYLKRLKAG